jgi:hypothetical protein
MPKPHIKAHGVRTDYQVMMGAASIVIIAGIRDTENNAS